MYKSIIEIRRDVPESMLSELAVKADRAFDNRAGKVKNVSTNPYKFIFEGGEEEYGCLDLGMLNLKREPEFLHYVESWQWIDEDPDECCDLLELLTKRE